MRSICLLILVLSVGLSYGQDIKSFDYCYTSKDGIYVYSAVKKKTELVVKGSDPYLSPDGSKLAYTANSPKGDRQVAVIDLATKQKTMLHTSNNNCYGPVWSPDGQFIAYNAFINNNWFICVIDKDNHTPVVITKTLNSGTGSYSPTWSADSKKILVQNMETIFVFTTQASLVEKIKITNLTDPNNISSSSKFLLNNDESKIIFDSETDDPGYDEPPSAIFIFDRKTKATKRITPKGFWCAQPFLRGDRIYFSSSKKNSSVSSICSVKADGSDFKSELSNASDFTARIN